MWYRKIVIAALALLIPAGARAGTGIPDCLARKCHAGTVPHRSPHRPASEGNCVACHLPRQGFSGRGHSAASFEEPFAAREACLGCHGRAEGPDGAGSFPHAPFRDGPCTACHAPHGSPLPALLLAPYPPSAYGIFEEDASALCWTCHDPALATVKFSRLATGFRMGERNFHYSHLHKRTGMTCRACHTHHGGSQPLLIREDPPEGASGWIERMTFERSPSGGRCRGGCHRDITYRR